MPVKIPPNQIQNLQQIAAVVAGPDDATRLFVIDGQFDGGVGAYPQGPAYLTQKETFSVLVGPVLTHKQFVSASATASLTKTSLNAVALPANNVGWQVSSIDADWDDESGQVELRIEASVTCSGQNNSCSINGFAFHVTILAAIAAA